jgi:hypothetical protein
MRTAIVTLITAASMTLYAQTPGTHELGPSETRWSSRLSPGATIEIRSGLGDIEVVKSEGDQLVVEVSRGTEGSVNPRVVVAETAKGAVVCADWTTGAGSPSPCTGSNRLFASNSLKNYRSVDLRIAVPEGTSVRAQTSEGDINVAPLKAAVVAKTYVGSVHATADGPKCKADNLRGGILDIAVTAEPIRQTVEISMISGEVRVALPPSRAVHYAIYPHGARVASAYPLDPQVRPERNGEMYVYREGVPNLSGNLGPSKEKITGTVEIFANEGADIEIAAP